MLKRIIRHEWRNVLADRTFALAAIVFALLIGYGIYNGSAWISRQQTLGSALIAERDKNLREAKAKLLEANGATVDPAAFDPSDPYDVAVSLQQVVLPFPPLAALSVGQSDMLPGNTGVSALSKQRTYADKGGFENPLSLFAGRFDLAFVIIYLLPLLIIALSYNLLSAEREQGLLALLLSQPLRLRTLAGGKVLQRAVLVLGLVFILAGAGLWLLGVPLFAAETLWRWLFWLLAVGAYASFWFGLALFVNALGRNSATNAFALAGAWLALVLIFPALLNVVVTSAHPVPSRITLINSVRDVQLDVRRDGSRLVSEFYQDHPEMHPEADTVNVNDFALASLTIQQEHRRRASEVEARFNEQLAKQQALVNRFRFLSPAIVMQEALNDLAGTGVARYQEFRRQTEQFDAAWSAYFLPRIYQKRKLAPADYDTIPTFAFAEEAWSAVASRMALGLAGLLLPAAWFTLWGIKRLSRYAIN